MKTPQVHYKRNSDDTKINPKARFNEKEEYATAQVTLKPTEYVDDLSMFEDDPKELHKFVVRTKYLIRNSYEYTQLVSFLKKYYGMDRCGIHTNIKKWDGFQIEIHHLLTIEDIIYIIINKRLKKGESLKQSLIAKEVMYDHYLGIIGLYPLCEVCHSYVHSDNSDLFIPLDVAFGDLEAFFDIYSDYIPDTMKIKFRNWIELTKGYGIIKSEIPDNLRRHLVYIDQNGNNDGISKKKLYDLIMDLNK